jgi:hypothetical protein
MEAWLWNIRAQEAGFDFVFDENDLFPEDVEEVVEEVVEEEIAEVTDDGEVTEEETPSDSFRPNKRARAG